MRFSVTFPRLYRVVFLLLPADLYQDFPAAGAVEFTKENSLPCAELQSPVLEQDLLAASDQGAFAVRIGVALEMPVARAVGRQQFFQSQENIMRDGRVGVFIDSNRRSRVVAIDDRLAIRNAGFADNRLDLAGDVNHFIAFFRTQTETALNDFHCYYLPPHKS
jgi:hypothetical protein